MLESTVAPLCSLPGSVWWSLIRGRAGDFGKVQQSPFELKAPGNWKGVKDTGSPRGVWEVTVAYKGPCVLPWLWEDVIYDGEVVLKPQPILFRAGEEGAAISSLPVGVQQVLLEDPILLLVLSALSMYLTLEISSHLDKSLWRCYAQSALGSAHSAVPYARHSISSSILLGYTETRW